ncbi:MAG: FG-GAP-like repeat-containing protein, partial [Pseudomonadota bacterium]
MANSYMWVSDLNVSYADALQLATTYTQNGVTGHLLTIESSGEETAVYNWLSANHQSTVYLGISDVTVEGTWVYTAGPNIGEQLLYNSWSGSEPNGGTSENYGVLHFWGVWLDYPSSFPNGAVQASECKGFVVEFESASGGDLTFSDSSGTIESGGGSSGGGSSGGGTPADPIQVNNNYDLSLDAPVSYETDSWPHFLIAVDMNGDELLDLAVLNSFSQSVKVYFNDGLGGFDTSKSYSLGGGINPSGLAVGDLNGDGLQDFVASDQYGSDKVTVIYGTGFGVDGLPTFSAPVKFQVGKGPVYISLADMNGDGHLDILSPNEGDGTFSVVFNDGFGSFGPASSYNVGGATYLTTAADLNGDGAADVVSGGASGVLYIYQNDGAGGFTLDQTIANGSHEFALGDINGDGFCDIISANKGKASISVLINDGLGHFTQTDYNAGSAPGWVSVVDVNGDGHNDLLVCNQGSSTLQLFINSGDAIGTLSSQLTYSIPSIAYQADAADLNGDGLIDIMSANVSTNSLSIFFQKTTIGTESSDTISATEDGVATGLGGNDTISGDAGNEELLGDNGSDSLSGGAGNDTLEGGSGNDVLAGGTGSDVLIGGIGDDEASYAMSSIGVAVNLLTGTGVGGDAQGDTLTGIEGVVGSGQNDSLIGGTGNDSLDGGSGNDVIGGGAGDDSLQGGTGVDTADYSSAQASIVVDLSIGTVTGNGNDSLSGIENVVGGQSNDQMNGSSGDNLLDGGAGNDTLAGGAGNDTYVVDSANDVVT